MGRLLIIVQMSLTGCVSQSNTIHKPGQVAFEPRLVGIWQTIEGGPKLTFDVRRWPQDDKTYHLVVSDECGRRVVAECSAQLSRIDGRHFLTVANVDHGQDRRYSTIVVDEWEPNLKVRILKRGWLLKAIEAKPTALSHRGTAKTDFLVTATTEELLAYYQKHLADESAWKKFVLAKKQ